MRKPLVFWRANARRARSIWGQLPPLALDALRELTNRFAVSVAAGDLQFLENRWYVTHAGLLRIALRRRCSGIRTVLQERQSDPVAGRWVFKATVYKSRCSRGFAGYGDADPTNVSLMVRGAEMRVAETRAVNRALRKAYGIGAALAAIAIVISMVGGKRKPARPWLSAAALRARWERTFVERIAVRPCSKSGKLIAMLRLSTKKETPGTVSCTKVSICSRSLSRTTGSASTTLGRVFRSRSCDPFPEAPSLWRTSMPSVKSAGSAA